MSLNTTTVQRHRDLSYSPMREPNSIMSVVNHVLKGKRITRAEASHLYADASLHTLAHLADTIRWRKHPKSEVTFVTDRSITYTNVCVCACRFCSFYREPGTEGGFVLTQDELKAKIDEALSLGATQIFLQGGHNPELSLSFYEEMIAWVRTQYPQIHIHAFSPPEILFLAEKEHMMLSHVIERLRAAGLDSISGGGAEILVDEVRSKISPNKCPSPLWLAAMEEVHYQGLQSTATMMFGHEESLEHRLDHLFSIREVQDRTGGFSAFIPWTFQPDNTDMDCEPETTPAYLRLLAMARIILDNIDHIQVPWTTMGPQVAQLALLYGANDFGSLMIEEKLVTNNGAGFKEVRKSISDIINAAGFTPVQRTMDYKPVLA